MTWTGCYSQNINSKSNTINALRPGDIMEITIIHLDDILSSLTDRNLDLTQADMVKSFICKYNTSERSTDEVMRTHLKGRNYFHQFYDTLFLCGTENNMVKIHYDKPETYLHVPLQAGDSIKGIYHGTGTFCDKLSLQRIGEYTTKTEDAGTLILPKGDTLRNVLRVHTRRSFITRTFPDDTLHHMNDSLTQDSIVSLLSQDQYHALEDEFRWYAPGYRYPVVEALIQHHRGRPCLSHIFLTPTEEQELLTMDEENEIIRRNADPSLQTSENNFTPNNCNEGKFHYSISTDASDISITYGHDEAATIKAILADKRGIIYKTRDQTTEAGEGYVLSINHNSLRRGQYILYIEAHGQRFSEKFNVK